MRRWMVLATAIALFCACSLAFPTYELRNDAGVAPANVDGAASSSSSSSGGGVTDAPNDGPSGPSCDGLAATCGGARSCCSSRAVPGTTFNRGNDPAHAATVSDFGLDVFEVTVGRFRAFVQGFKRPNRSDGKDPHLPGDPGWSAIEDGRLAGSGTELAERLIGGCLDGTTTWTADKGANEGLPMTCVTWTEAFAFCIWDRGRLPTEAEWNLAAAGGTEQRIYPWPSSTPPIDDAHAVFEGSVLAVGSKSPLGDGRWGHADLAGNVAEWVRDAAGDYPSPCVDCANVSDASQRTLRGGSFASGVEGVKSSARAVDDPEHRDARTGFRCAR